MRKYINQIDSIKFTDSDFETIRQVILKKYYKI